jgi:sugar O-acyltransferase (sialic acid O-acetyltransferase NeuD family)
VARWIVFACRTPYALEVAETIWRRGDEVAALVDNLPATERAPAELRCSSRSLSNKKEQRNKETGEAEAIGAPLLSPAELAPDHLSLPVAIPLITPGHRFVVEAEARSLGFDSFPALIDPTAVIARTAQVGEGSAINAAAVIASGTTLGRSVHVNRSASVGHHNLIEDYATLGPSCVLAGHVTIGRGAFVGAGAVCAPKVTVGPNAVVGAGAVVVRDVPAGKAVVGNPAKEIPGKAGGYGGVTVPEAER